MDREELDRVADLHDAAFRAAEAGEAASIPDYRVSADPDGAFVALTPSGLTGVQRAKVAGDIRRRFVVQEREGVDGFLGLRVPWPADGRYETAVAVAEPEVAPWRPSAREGESAEDLPLNEWVGQAIGTASMCWIDPGGAGEFDSARASWVMDGLMAHLNAVIDGVIAGTLRAAAAEPVVDSGGEGAAVRERWRRIVRAIERGEEAARSIVADRCGVAPCPRFGLPAFNGEAWECSPLHVR